MLDPLLIFVGAVVVICLATAFGPRFNLAGPLILMALGLGVSLLPFVPALEIDPELILVVVLPPLLYSAAVQLPAIEFRRDFGPIAGLSVLLVVVSSIVLGLFFAWLIPGLGIALGIALGAILSPTDAVATSIAKRLGISTRVVTLLEGESLLNDATALVLLRTAIAAVAGGFAFGDTVFAFAQAVIVAVLVGAVVGWLNLRVRAWVAHSAANTALSFTIPFIAYLPSEHLGGSGLVAAVVAGIVTGQGAARWFTPDERISDRLNWRTVELLLEGAVFLVMGLELKEIVQRNLERDQGLWQGAWLAVAALAIVLLVRSAYVAMLIWLQGRRRRLHGRTRERVEAMDDRLDQFEARLDAGPPDVVRGPGRGPDRPTRRFDMAHARRRLEMGRSRLRRLVADLDYYRDTPLDWRHGSVIVWAGMRGVVTLAAAQTLPRDTVERPLLIFVAFLVAVLSLLLQGLTLPGLVRMLGLTDDKAEGPTREEQQALNAELRSAAGEAVAAGKLQRRDGEPFPENIVRVVGARMTQPPDEDVDARTQEVLELRLAIIEVMRARLAELSHDGRHATAALRHALAELDADQLSLELRLDDAD